MSSEKWRHLVVAIRSPDRRQQLALGKAAAIARRCGARITLLHAFSVPYPLPARMPVNSEALLKASARERMQQLKELARPLKEAGLRIRTEVVWDFPAFEAIIRFVLREKPDLVVADSERHSRIGRWFLANTDWELIRECPCPVWFVKQARLAAAPRFLIAVDPTHARAKPSRLDDRLTAAAVQAMGHVGGQAAFVHAEALQPVLPRGFMAEVMIPGDVLKVSRQQRKAARATIERLAQRHGLAGAPEVIRPGPPRDVIEAAVQQVKADVLVMGAVSRRGLSRSFVGSTAEHVLDVVGCDLLIVKQAGFRTGVPRRMPKLAPVPY